MGETPSTSNRMKRRSLFKRLLGFIVGLSTVKSDSTPLVEVKKAIPPIHIVGDGQWIPVDLLKHENEPVYWVTPTVEGVEVEFEVATHPSLPEKPFLRVAPRRMFSGKHWEAFKSSESLT